MWVLLKDSTIADRPCWDLNTYPSALWLKTLTTKPLQLAQTGCTCCSRSVTKALSYNAHVQILALTNCYGCVLEQDTQPSPQLYPLKMHFIEKKAWTKQTNVLDYVILYYVRLQYFTVNMFTILYCHFFPQCIIVNYYNSKLL